MPTYEYNCPKCGVIEQFHSISTVLTECPQCGSKVRRLISRNNNVIFKGSGFYTTDYKSSDHKSKAARDTSGSSASTTPVKTDAKTADAKSEDKASSSKKNESKAS
jgi:putative FmdB family regulatory protein